jgi:hypothetical protein
VSKFIFKMARGYNATHAPYLPRRGCGKQATPSRYANGCRCKYCREAWRRYHRARRGLDPNVPRSATNRGRPPKEYV